MKIAIVTTLKAPLDDTMRWVHYHLNLGVDHLLLFFDDPADPAIAALASYRQVKCTPCGLSHWRENGTSADIDVIKKQYINGDLGLNEARRLGCDWVIHIDQDELLHADGSIHDILARVPSDIDAARFALLEASAEFFEYESCFEEINLFRVHSSDRKMRIAHLLGCRRAIWNGDYLRGHVASKVATRVSDRVERLRIHRPLLANGTEPRIQSLDSIRLLHFDCRGFGPWEEKWDGRLSQPDPYDGMRVVRYRQLRRFASTKTVEDRLALYRRLNHLPRHERWILGLLGMLRRIDISPAMFSASTTPFSMPARRRAS